MVICAIITVLQQQVTYMNNDEQITQLAHEIQALKAENLLFKSRCEQYAEAYEYLHEQIIEMRRQRFGARSERHIDDPENPQLSLFNDVSAIFAAADVAGEQAAKEITLVAAHSRKKNAKNKDDLPRRIVVIPLSDKDKQCACGACKTIIKYEVKELIHYQPCVIELIEQRREVAACSQGCDGSVVTATAPIQILPKIKATEEFLSFLAVSKLDDRQPLYYLERQLKDRHGIDCSRQTMARWLIELTEPLRPIYNLLKDYLPTFREQ